MTVDAAAEAGKDYDKVDEIVVFEKGQATKTIEVKIIDDDVWEADEDFYVHLRSIETGEDLEGKDCKTRVTILDDDKPGQVCFREKKIIKTLAPPKDGKEQIEVVVCREKGSDGTVTVQYTTDDIDKSKHTAKVG